MMRKRLGGFTLIEVLAALFLFSLLTLGVSSSVREISKLSSRIKIRQATVVSGITAFDRIQRDLRMAFNERLRNSSSWFESDSTSLGPDLRFTTWESPTVLLFTQRTPGLAAVRYWLEKADDGTMNLMRSQVEINRASDLEKQAPEIVGQGILKLEFEFYQGNTGQWLKSWDSKQSTTTGLFPRAVRVRLSSVDPSVPEPDRKEKTLNLETTVLVINEWEDRN
jgi:prepilin-type N-terminal cleavage/methylation domain-containing protein